MEYKLMFTMKAEEEKKDEREKLKNIFSFCSFGILFRKGPYHPLMDCDAFLFAFFHLDSRHVHVFVFLESPFSHGNFA